MSAAERKTALINQTETSSRILTEGTKFWVATLAKYQSQTYGKEITHKDILDKYIIGNTGFGLWHLGKLNAQAQLNRWGVSETLRTTFRPPISLAYLDSPWEHVVDNLIRTTYLVSKHSDQFQTDALAVRLVNNLCQELKPPSRQIAGKTKAALKTDYLLIRNQLNRSNSNPDFLIDKIETGMDDLLPSLISDMGTVLSTMINHPDKNHQKPSALARDKLIQLGREIRRNEALTLAAGLHLTNVGQHENSVPIFKRVSQSLFGLAQAVGLAETTTAAEIFQSIETTTQILEPIQPEILMRLNLLAPFDIYR